MRALGCKVRARIILALAKKGLRRLEYKGLEYGWIIRKKPTYGQGVFRSSMTLAIQLMDHESPQILLVTLNVDRPDNWIQPHQTGVTPSVVKDIIESAIGNGWVPSSGGSAFQYNYSIVKNI